MKGKLVLVFGVLLVFSFVCEGCTSVSGNVESALSFSCPISINNLIVGSFSYNINDTYIVRPDDSLIPEPSFSEKKGHEAYYEEQVLLSDGNPKLGSDGKPMTRIVMKDEYHIASYDELYLWAIRCAAKKAEITDIIALKSFITTTTRNVAGVTVAWQNVTVTVYGESVEELTE
jgi:hypothetical protein